jgi:peptidoglycan-associated lipoprotein
MKHTAKLLTVFIIAIFALTLVTCAKKVVKTEEPIPPPQEEVQEPEVKPVETPTQVTSQMQNIYFDFDRSDIRPGDAKILENNAMQLKDNPNTKIMIEGHCDPIGTNEYNMALGWRRANSAQDYLAKLGVGKSQMSTISYGEEKLVTTNEAEYQLDRRCEFKAQ